MKINEKYKAKPKINLDPGFKQFLWKTGIFAVLFIAIQLLTIPLQTIQLPTEYYKILDTDIGKSLLFTVMIFFFLSREKLKSIKDYNFESKNTLIFGIITIITFVGYFLLKNFLGNHQDFAIEYIHLFLPLKYIILIIGAGVLAVSIFGLKMFKDFITNFKKQLVISLFLFIIVLFSIIEFQKLWVYFSYAVAKSVYFLLNLTFDTTLNFVGTIPNLGITNNFVVNIGQPCSGVDSMLMFIFLYIFIAGYDWNKFNKKKLAIMFIPGIISVFILNLIRIYLLITIGAFVSQDFAIGFFHTSASMILFLGYFILFWGLLYKWMKK